MAGAPTRRWLLRLRSASSRGSVTSARRATRKLNRATRRASRPSPRNSPINWWSCSRAARRPSRTKSLRSMTRASRRATTDELVACHRGLVPGQGGPAAWDTAGGQGGTVTVGGGQGGPGWHAQPLRAAESVGARLVVAGPPEASFTPGGLAAPLCQSSGCSHDRHGAEHLRCTGPGVANQAGRRQCRALPDWPP
jgi:hypothetical protein